MNAGEPVFEICGEESTLSEMLEANPEDEYVTEWLRNAKVGDVFDEFNSERVVRIR